MKESRLFKIVYYLLDKGHASASELAKEFEVSVRTIYRDVEALSGAGIPIYAETGRSGGIFLLENFVLNKMLLSDSEKQDLLYALQSLSVTGTTLGTETLTKLSALFRIQSDNWFEVDFSRWGSKPKDNAKFEHLKHAIINHKTIFIVYVSSYGHRSKRKIEPLKLLYKAKEWYIKAYCTEKEDFRLFKFNRILDLEVTDEIFTPMDFPEEPDTAPKAYRNIKLRFPKEMAYRIYDEFDADEIEVLPSGALVTCAPMPEDAWLIGYLLSFGTKVEVIEPAYLRRILADEAKKIIALQNCETMT